MPRFKTYDGTIIEMPSHTHTVSDTVNSKGSIALATTSEDGFMSKEDKVSLNSLDADITSIEEKLKYAIYLDVTQEDINLQFDSTNSNLTVYVSNNSGTWEANGDIIVAVTAKAIGTLKYNWTASWYYHGPNYTENDLIGSGYFTDTKNSILGRDKINAFANKNSQSYSHMTGTVTITNTVYGRTSMITKNFTIEFLS